MPVLRLHEPGMLVGALRLLRTRRQLADRIAKALKEIEKLWGNQTETGSVMTASGGRHPAGYSRDASGGTSKAIAWRYRANRIDTCTLITAETVEQTETSRAVASVMQSVEHSTRKLPRSPACFRLSAKPGWVVVTCSPPLNACRNQWVNVVFVLVLSCYIRNFITLGNK